MTYCAVSITYLMTETFHVTRLKFTRKKNEEDGCDTYAKKIELSNGLIDEREGVWKKGGGLNFRMEVKTTKVGSEK